MISVVVPTYNEQDNLPVLVEKIFSALGDHPGEVVVVDDNSPDGTGEIAEKLKSRYPVQVIHREGKLGLATAVMAGFQSAKGEILCVIDADLSHDPALLPEMIKALDAADLAIGSRYIKGGGMKGWPKYREFGSRFAILLSRPLTSIHDATSGYFCFRRKVMDGVRLDPLGFKIGLEIFVKGNYSRFVELPYIFQDRQSGKSKLNKKEIFNYLKHLLKLYSWKLNHLHSFDKKSISRQNKPQS
ncbi:MAG: polyprenol monophosphomannose synthase [Candidatus Eremiobacteraeota bacterium]|nr:polyprenol monophosphomannose synthase [Candidatus Eremiobacteraeota bacterium]MCL5056377.1 polyprenol monophosphomannose synthase [Bacillota bacterium]